MAHRALQLFADESADIAGPSGAKDLRSAAAQAMT